MLCFIEQLFSCKLPNVANELHWKLNYNLYILLLAHDILGNPVKRKSYDSVDSNFDNEIPTSNVKKAEFYSEFGPVFQRNSL